jgi:prepilin-type N-terminal cleavage/methylation domain-containing protein
MGGKMVSGKNRLISFSSGFTLIELLITLAISSLILTAVYNVFQSNSIIYIKHKEMVNMEENLRSAMHFMVSKIRMSGYNSTDTINENSTIDQIIFYNNQDKYEISYYADSKFSDYPVLGFKNHGAIATNVENLMFKYWNSTDWDHNAKNVQNISKVEIYLEAFSDKTHLDISNLPMSRTVYIRNACLDD